MENWYLPITLVPGIGLLILSTSNLMLTLSNEINLLIKETIESDAIITRKLNQLKRLNSAMVFLYIAVACLVTSGLIGGIGNRINFKNEISIYIAIAGIVVVLLALLLLIVYSFKAVTIRQDQFQNSLKKIEANA